MRHSGLFIVAKSVLPGPSAIALGVAPLRVPLASYLATAVPIWYPPPHRTGAAMAELVDALACGASAARRGSSSLLGRTKLAGSIEKVIVCRPCAALFVC